MDSTQKERLEKHLKEASIKVRNFDAVEGLVKILDSNDATEEEVNLFFIKNEIMPTTDEVQPYYDAAYIAYQVLNFYTKNSDIFIARATKDAIRYDVSCEIRAALTKDKEKTIHGLHFKTMSDIRTFARQWKAVYCKEDFDYMVDTIKVELGLVKPQKPPAINGKKRRKEENSEQQEPEHPKAAEAPQEIVTEVTKSTGESVVSRSYDTQKTSEPCYATQPKKFVPSPPGKKRHQQPKVVFDAKKLTGKVKGFINAEKPIEDIVGYLTDEMVCSKNEASDFIKKLVYTSIADAIWSDNPATRNMISYMDIDAQVTLAKDYLRMTSIPEKNGLSGISSAKRRLQRYLSLEEKIIDSIIDSELRGYFEKKRASKAAAPTAPRFVVDDNKPVYCTKHIKERALERIGEDADIDWVIRDFFRSGKTTYVENDYCLHRIFEFSGIKFGIPYYETNEEYVLLTVYPAKNNVKNGDGSNGRH